MGGPRQSKLLDRRRRLEGRRARVDVLHLNLRRALGLSLSLHPIKQDLHPTIGFKMKRRCNSQTAAV